MKTGTTEHPKFRILKARLGLPDYQVVGVLESIWNATAKWKDHGGVGEWTNEQICVAIGWEKDPNELIQSLIDTGWLDPHDTYRLVIHDWQDHRPKYVTDRVRIREHRARSGMSATNGYTTPSVAERSKMSLPTQPNPTQPNQLIYPQTPCEGGQGQSEASADEADGASPADDGDIPPDVTPRKPRPRFTPPTIDEAALYAAEIGLSVDDSRACYDHHLARGWMVSRMPMKDWRACWRTWRRNVGRFGGKPALTSTAEWKKKPYCPG